MARANATRTTAPAEAAPNSATAPMGVQTAGFTRAAARTRPPGRQAATPPPLGGEPVAASNGLVGEAVASTLVTPVRSASQTSSQAASLASVTAPPSLWSEKHMPRNESELVVNKKRIETVREMLAAGSTRLLILKGPPGCGKASVLKAVCEDLGYEVVEWSPAMRGGPAALAAVRNSGAGQDSLSDAFLRFLAQTDRYSGLEVAPTNGAGMVAGTSVRRRKRVALVRDFPFTLMESGGARRAQSQSFLDRFRDAVRAGTLQRTVLCFNDAREDYHVVTRLLAQVDPSATSTVTFDTVARTFAQRALDAIVKQEGVPASVANTAAIAAECGGDLRHAINALQLVAGGLCQHPVSEPAKNRGAARTSGAKSGRGGKVASIKAAEVDSAAADAVPSLAMRPAALGLFHSLGRLLWCKRIPPPTLVEDCTSLGSASQASTQASTAPVGKRRRKNNSLGDQPDPKQLPHELLFPKAKRPPLYFLPEEVLSQSNTEPRNMVEWIFTNAPRFYGDIGDLAEFTGALAESDAWDLDHRRFHGGEAVLPPWDGLACAVQARALLDANLHPIPPAFGDMCCAPQMDAEANNFNMVRPLLRDVARHRQRRVDELGTSLEVIGPLALGSIGTSSSALLTRTLPHVHLLMLGSRGSHRSLQHLPHALMRLAMELSAFDGGILKRVSDTGEGGGDDSGLPNRRAAEFQTTWTLPSESWTALADDPIED